MSIHETPFSSLPAFVSARRRSLGLSPAELAARCRMSRDAVERLEEGRFLPSPSQACRLALALGIDPVDLGQWAITELLLRPEFLAEHVSQASA